MCTEDVVEEKSYCAVHQKKSDNRNEDGLTLNKINRSLVDALNLEYSVVNVDDDAYAEKCVEYKSKMVALLKGMRNLVVRIN
ncbi:hypothetical protein HK100_007270 [Physocladia obscura]|uniref:Uncharacterized protein n=1 Tax=Physocladia obscura TaxID=109957 RepID=A0AAD5SQJ9_9FUNG|nr:hypothetical protein HK100_007270 [Physocladia obscura]